MSTARTQRRSHPHRVRSAFGWCDEFRPRHAIVALLIGGLGRTGTAQSAKPASAGTASVVMDTTLQAGHRDFSRYTTPGMCVEAALQVFLNETRGLDMGYYASIPREARLPATDSSVTLAHQCGGKFSVASVPPIELLNLTELSLLARDDARAIAAANQWLTTVVPSDTFHQGWGLVTLLSLTENAGAQSKFLPTMLARLDDLQPAANEARMTVYKWLLTKAVAQFDPQMIERYAFKHDSALGQKLQREKLGQKEPVHLYAMQDRMHLAEPHFALTQAKAAADPRALPGLPDSLKRLTGVDFGDSVILTYAIGSTNPAPFPPMPVDYWFGNQGPHQWPVPGKASLYWDFGNAMEENFDRGDSTYAPYQMLRQLRERFKDSVNLTVTYRLHGYFRNSGPLAPPQEAERVRQYFLDYLKLPVNLAIMTTTFDTLFDGRRVPRQGVADSVVGYKMQETGNEARGIGPFGIADVNGGGVLRPGSPPENLREIEVYLERALKPGTAAPQKNN